MKNNLLKNIKALISKALARAFFNTQNKEYTSTHPSPETILKHASIRPEDHFWEAFDACRKKQYCDARAIFEDCYRPEGMFQIDAPRYRLYTDCAIFGYHDATSRSLLDILVLINDQTTLCRIARMYPDRCIDVIEACITFHREIVPLHLILPTEEDWEALLKTYEIEGHVLLKAQEVNQSVKAWLERRNRRAHALRRKQHIDELCQEYPAETVTV